MRQHGRNLTAFVLAGGGSLGAVQVGMLAALTRRGVVPDFVVGASVGAINAAYYAAEPDERGVERLKRIWLGLRRTDVFPFSPLVSMLAQIGKAALDERVIKAMGKVPRHDFVPVELERYSYANVPLPIGFDKTISQPFIVALMMDLLPIDH